MTARRDLFAAIVVAGISIGCGGEPSDGDSGTPPTDSGALADAATAMDAGAGLADAGLEDAGEDAMVAIL